MTDPITGIGQTIKPSSIKSGTGYIALIVSTVILMYVMSPLMAEAARDEDFYRRMINTDLVSLKKQADGMLFSMPDSSIAYYSVVAARYYPDMPDKDKSVCANAMNNLGYLHFYNHNDPVMAYSYLVRGMSVAEELEDRRLLSNLALNMGNVFGTLDEFDSSLECFRRAVREGLAGGEYEVVLTALSNAISLISTTSPDRKIDELMPEIADIRKVKLPELPMLGYTMSLLTGAEALGRGEYTEAEKHFTASLGQINTKLTPERFRQMSLGLLANLEYIRGNFREALKYLHIALDETEAPDIRAALYNQLQRSYKGAGCNEEAAFYLNRYVMLTDTLLRSGQTKALRDIELQNSASEFDRRISLAAAERRQLIMMLVIILVALTGMSGLGIWLWVSRRRLKIANEELYRQARSRTLALVPETEAGADTAGGEEAELASRLCSIMKTSPEIYGLDFSLDSLAQLAGVPPRKVSKAINARFGMNFNTFLQKYRVEEACRRFDDRERYGSHTIEAISEGVGFKSRSNFVAVFKKFTGLTPSAYQKIGACHRMDEES